jgi:hypothetical protein
MSFTGKLTLVKTMRRNRSRRRGVGAFEGERALTAKKDTRDRGHEFHPLSGERVRRFGALGAADQQTALYF